MKLSDAIRLGAMLRPQAYGPSGAKGSCALRAAADAVGIPDDCLGRLDYRALQIHFPVLQRLAVHCPSCSVRDPILMTALYHLNDHHRWTREEIADWVEQQELAATSLAVAHEGQEHTA